MNPKTNPMSPSSVAIILQLLNQRAPLHGAQWFHHPSEQFTEERKRETKAPVPAEARLSVSGFLSLSPDDLQGPFHP